MRRKQWISTNAVYAVIFMTLKLETLITELRQALRLKAFLMTGHVLYAAQAKTFLRKNLKIFVLEAI
jgi:hypothetical protein